MTDPDRADDINEALAELRPELRTAMAALYDIPSGVPVAIISDGGEEIGAIWPLHLGQALLTGRITADTVLDLLTRRGLVSPTVQVAEEPT